LFTRSASTSGSPCRNLSSRHSRVVPCVSTERGSAMQCANLGLCHPGQELTRSAQTRSHVNHHSGRSARRYYPKTSGSVSRGSVRPIETFSGGAFFVVACLPPDRMLFVIKMGRACRISVLVLFPCCLLFRTFVPPVSESYLWTL
jgi:hypothetical protein